MGKLAVISDLHADINRLTIDELAQIKDYLLQQQVTHLHLAGDSANQAQQVLAIVDFFKKDLPTTFHWGNHELVSLRGEAEFECFEHPDFLNFKTVSLAPNVLLLGVNGWYDYQFSSISDEAEILRMKNLYWYDRAIKRQVSDPQTAAIIAQRLEQTLDQLPKEKHLIVSTHFVTDEAFIFRYRGKCERWNQLNAFLGSKTIGQVIAANTQISQVVFGHTHHRFNPQVINQKEYHCRPLGYYYEWQITRRFMQEYLNLPYSPGKAKGTIKRHQTQFDHYRRIHLIEEVKEAISIISFDSLEGESCG